MGDITLNGSLHFNRKTTLIGGGGGELQRSKSDSLKAGVHLDFTHTMS